MLPAGFETINSTRERSQTYTVERSVNGTCIELSVYKLFILCRQDMWELSNMLGPSFL